MHETVPRRRGPSLFAQVTLAVISGAAAMYCIENFKAAPSLKALLTPANLPGQPGAPPVALVQPVPPPPEANKPPKALAPAEPVANSMMVKPEPGGTPLGMLRVSGDEPADQPKAEAPALPAPPGEAPRVAEEPEKEIRLKTRRAYGANQVGHGFQDIEFKPLSFKKKQAPRPPPAAPKPAPRQEAPPPEVKTTPRLIEKEPIKQEDLMVPSTLTPEAPRERPYWTEERKMRVGIAGLIAIGGAAYFMFAAGLLTALKDQRPHD